MKKDKKEKAPALSEPLVAIDLGSYSIKAIAAQCLSNSPLHILGYEEKPMNQSIISHGLVVNSSEVGYVISEILKKLGNRIGADSPLTSAFITIGGRSLRMARIPVKRMLGRKLSVSEKVIKGMEEECINRIEHEFKGNDTISLSLEPLEFMLDGELQYETPTPAQKAQKIEATYIAFIGSKYIQENTYASFARSKVLLEHQWVRPLAQLKAIVGDDYSGAGCAIIDFGDQTTTVFIYNNNHIVFAKTIPLGGFNITRDIEQCGISRNDAMKIKHLYGYASKSCYQKDMRLSIRSVKQEGEKVTLSFSDISDIVASRLDEIIDPIKKELDKYIDYYEDIFITGGGARLQGIIPYLSERFGIEASFGTHYEWLTEDTPAEFEAPEFSTLIGTLVLADDFRNNPDNHLDNNAERPDGLWGRFKKTIQQGVIDFVNNE